jgi:hypothetical protein
LVADWISLAAFVNRRLQAGSVGALGLLFQELYRCAGPGDRSPGRRPHHLGRRGLCLFFALAANDRVVFDRLLKWTQDNLASGDLQTHLPAWLWGRDKDGEWKTLDPNSASDADVWMAYSLIEAGRLWKSPYYTRMGRQMMVLIAKNEVADMPGFGPMLLPGPVGFQHGKFWTLNPSYMPLFIFERLAAIDPSGPWGLIALGIPAMLEQSARHGYAMDWVDYLPGDGFYPATEMHPGKQGVRCPRRQLRRHPRLSLGGHARRRQNPRPHARRRSGHAHLPCRP